MISWFYPLSYDLAHPSLKVWMSRLCRHTTQQVLDMCLPHQPDIAYADISNNTLYSLLELILLIS